MNQYLNQTALKLATKRLDNIFPMVNPNHFDMFLNHVGEPETNQAKVFSLTFQRRTAKGTVNALKVDQSMYLDWMLGCLAFGIVYFTWLYLYHKYRRKEVWEIPSKRK